MPASVCRGWWRRSRSITFADDFLRSISAQTGRGDIGAGRRRPRRRGRRAQRDDLPPVPVRQPLRSALRPVGRDAPGRSPRLPVDLISGPSGMFRQSRFAMSSGWRRQHLPPLRRGSHTHFFGMVLESAGSPTAGELAARLWGWPSAIADGLALLAFAMLGGASDLFMTKWIVAQPGGGEQANSVARRFHALERSRRRS